MSMKRTVAFILCLMMLVTAMPLGVFAFPTNTLDTIVSDVEYDYFHKYSFDNVAVGTTTKSNKLPGSDTSSPYGFSSVTGMSTVVKAREDGNGNYLTISYPTDRTSGNIYAHFFMEKNGKSYGIGNTISFEFDIRWQGVADTNLISDDHVMNLLYVRCAANSGHLHSFLQAKLIAGTEEVDGETVTVPDKYLKIYTPNGNDIVTLEKESTDFTTIKTVYYNATQTYSVYVGDTLVVEAGSCTFSNGKQVEQTELIGAHTSFTYDDDGIVTSRELTDELNGTLTHHPYFVFGHVGYSSTLRTPYIIDVDNLCMKEEEVSDGRTAYYENSFEGTYGDLVVASHANTFTYEYTDRLKYIARQTPVI